MKKTHLFSGFIVLLFGIFIHTAYSAFSDVPTQHVHGEAIGYLEEKGIISGYGNGEFRPENTINRAEFLKIVLGSTYQQEEIFVEDSQSSLTDLESSSWFYAYVTFALKKGIIKGYPDKTFRAGNSITLAEALKIIIETNILTQPQYIKNPEEWYIPYMDTASSYKLFENITNTQPERIITRGEVAQLIFNVFKNTTRYKVINVVDGDTIDIEYHGATERIRLLGIDTPETVHPSKPVECFGKEASEKTKELLLGKEITLEFDVTQGERDIYNRLLAYVFVESVLINEQLIREGYAFEYTYVIPHKYKESFENAEKEAQNNALGLWNPQVCPATSDMAPDTSVKTFPTTENSCSIKGNINSRGEKIYHLENCASYDKTVINETAGEQWFCTEEDAINAGWRKAGNC